MIKFAESDIEIGSCYPVMKELRPNIDQSDFIEKIRVQMHEQYRLAYLESDSVVTTVAGFRTGHNLAWGKYMYIDDLVTAKNSQGKGFGRRLLSWLISNAEDMNCNQVHLDSGTQRNKAHRFYLGTGFDIKSFHFSKELK